jgi:hypothetical protein
MKNLIVTFLLMATVGQTYASDVTTCNADILTSICGSGNVEISIDNDSMSFQLHYGDVGCWFTEIKIEGKLIEEKAPHHLFGSKKFQLVTDTDNIEIGKLIYSSQDRYRNGLAQLTVISNKVMSSQGALFGRFNLGCDK